MLFHYWNSLPDPIKPGLRIGSVGAAHLRRLASTASKCSGSTLHLEFLVAAWEEDPLDGDLAASIVRIGERSPCIGRELKQILTLVSEHWLKPDSIANYQAFILAKEFEEALNYVRQAMRESPNLFWRQQALTLCEILGTVHQAFVFLKSGPAELAPLFSFLRGNIYFQQNEWKKAEQEYANAPDGMLLPVERRAEAFEQLQQPEKARKLRTAVLRKKPWHTTLALRAYETSETPPLVSKLPESSCAVLLYSFNKADYLDACIRSVAASSGWNRIFALNNGSSDLTQTILHAWQEKLGKEKLHLISLPVNIGAAAARNWLIQEAAAYAFDYVAFLDDDVVLPPDWLFHIATARTRYPKAGVWGCRVVDLAAPYLAQSADMHLLPGAETHMKNGTTRPDDTSQACSEPFSISDLHNQVADYGQFQYVRPCDSVTGCCHVFPLKRLLESGLFALQLSPSQYDDLEHDIRMLSQGAYACYQGKLAIKHAKRSGRAVRLDRPAYGNWLANKFKLLRMYTNEEIKKFRRNGDIRLEEDLSAKLHALDAAIEHESGI